ncbi:conserved domain protein [Streptococcus sp. oral taxon 056 str. F0418]|nr:conserved domain protein [Streptococcus sp. oral taxon 056 str. F0418]
MLLASVFVLAFMIVQPINRVPDESNHARMTWEIFHKSTNRSFKWMDELPSAPDVTFKEYQRLFSEKIDLSQEEFAFGFNLKTIFFLPQLIGMSLGSFIYPSVGLIVMMGRLFNTLAYIFGVYFLIKYFKYGKKALLFLSLLPIMVQQAASLSYDVMNYLEIMLAIGFLTNIAYSKQFSNRNVLELLVISIGLFVTKPNNVLLLGLLPFVEFEFEGFLAVLNKPFVATKAFVACYLPIFYVLGFATFFLVLHLAFRNQGGLVHYGQVLLNTLFKQSVNGDLNTILTIGMFGFLGNFTIQLLLWLIFIDVAVLALLFLQSQKDFMTKGYTVTSCYLFVVQVIAIISIMYLQWTPIVLGKGAMISVGAQGRYFTPFLILFLPAVANLGILEIKEKVVNRMMIGTLVANFLIALYLMLPFYWNLLG